MTPEGWSEETLDQCVERITSGGTPRAGDQTYYTGEIPFLKIEDLTNAPSLVLTSALSHISERAIQETPVRLYPPGTVLVTMYGTIGAVGITGVPMAANQAIAAFLKPHKVEDRFLAYRLAFDAPRLAHKAGQTTQANISLGVLKGHSIPVPPLAEQKKIAEILGSVDEAIQATQAVIDHTRKVKQGLLQQLLTRGIGHTRFKQTEIGEIPESWEVRALGDLATKERASFCNGPFGSDLLTSELRPSGVPVVYIRDIRSTKYEPRDQVFVEENKAEDLDAFRVESGDLLMTKVGDPPVVAALYPTSEPKGIVTQDVMRLRVDDGAADAGFLRLLINSQCGLDLIERIAIEGTRKRVALGALKRLKIPVPPLREQRILRQQIDEIEGAEDASRHACERACKAKRGLMQDLLTGRVRVAP